jgi:antitoxin MazE
MKARLVHIGNSRGVRLPKPFIEEVGLSEIVDLHVRGGTIVISPSHVPRVGWAEAAQELAQVEGGGLLEPDTSSTFDQQEWQW